MAGSHVRVSAEGLRSSGRRGWPGAIADDIDAVGSAGLDVVLFKALLDLAPELAADRELLAGTSLDEEKIVDLLSCDPVNSGYFGLRDNVLMITFVFVHLMGNFLQYGDYLVAVFLVVNGDLKGQLRPIAGQVTDDAHLAIGHGVDSTIGVTQDGPAKGDALDRSLNSGGTDRVADIEGVFDEDEESVDEVLDERLGAEADGKTGNACRCEQGADVEAENGQNRSCEIKNDDDNADAVDDAGQGTKLLGAESGGEVLARTLLNELVPQYSEDHEQYESDYEGPDDLGYIVAKEADGVVAPVVQQVSELISGCLRL